MTPQNMYKPTHKCSHKLIAKASILTYEKLQLNGFSINNIVFFTHTYVMLVSHTTWVVPHLSVRVYHQWFISYQFKIVLNHANLWINLLPKASHWTNSERRETTSVTKNTVLKTKARIIYCNRIVRTLQVFKQ